MENTLFNSNRINVKDVIAYLEENQGLQASFLDKGLGYGLNLKEGDEITLTDDIVVCSMGKAIVQADGTFDKCYLSIVATVKTAAGVTITGDIPAAAFVRSGRKYPSLEDEVKRAPNLRGLDLYEEYLKGMDAKIVAFNRQLTLRESALTKLQGLSGKTLKVIAAKPAFRLRFKAERPENYGSDAKDWDRITILFFEDATPAQNE